MHAVLASDTLLPESYHHNAYEFSLLCNDNNSLKYEVYYYDFRNAHFFQLNYFFSSVNWNDTVGGDNIDVAFMIQCTLLLLCLFPRGSSNLVIFLIGFLHILDN